MQLKTNDRIVGLEYCLGKMSVMVEDLHDVLHANNRDRGLDPRVKRVCNGVTVDVLKGRKVSGVSLRKLIA